MLKMHIFLEKYCKNCFSVCLAWLPIASGGRLPPGVASGGWGLRPQTPASLLPPTITILSNLFLPLKMRFITLKMTLCFYFFLRSFALIFHYKLCRFYDRGGGDAKLLLAPGRRVP